MEKKSFVTVFIILGLLIAFLMFNTLKTSKYELVFDAQNKNSLPANFRAVSDLKMFGSAQFSQAELSYFLSIFQQPIVIVDLRQETHGFIDGNAVSWMKKVSGGLVPTIISDKNNQQALQLARKMGTTEVYEVASYNDVLFYNRSVVPLPMVNSGTEMELANVFNLPYAHFAVNYQAAPEPNTVDLFIKFMQTLPSNTWLYFHCRDGINRTNVFMAMYDMLQNAKILDFQTIINREYIKTPKEFPEPYSTAQLAFLKQFYLYCRNNTDNYQTTWSQWENANPPVM